MLIHIENNRIQLCKNYISTYQGAKLTKYIFQRLTRKKFNKFVLEKYIYLIYYFQFANVTLVTGNRISQ